MLDDGAALFDSQVICEYLESLRGTSRIFPPGAARWRALRLNALADGLLESAMSARFETTGAPADKQWSAWTEVQSGRSRTASPNRLESEAAAFAKEPTIGEIALGCTLGWLDFRMPEVDWRKGRPTLASWFEQVARRVR